MNRRSFMKRACTGAAAVALGIPGVTGKRHSAGISNIVRKWPAGTGYIPMLYAPKFLEMYYSRHPLVP